MVLLDGMLILLLGLVRVMGLVFMFGHVPWSLCLGLVLGVDMLCAFEYVIFVCLMVYIGCLWLVGYVNAEVVMCCDFCIIFIYVFSCLYW